MLSQLSSYIDFSQPSLRIAVLLIVLAPTIWNILARLEYYTHILTKLFCGNKKLGCYALALYIFSFSAFRDMRVSDALADQPTWEALGHPAVVVLAVALAAFGLTLVVTSTWALGITGTYLGDYFGILMESKVTGFPFNLLNNPMYDGSTMLFTANALWNRSVAGLFLAAVVFVVYRVALMFEEPFTNKIYAAKAKKQAIAAASKKTPKKQH